MGFVIQIILILLVERATGQYSCSVRPDGQCKPCDCVPDCFDLSDEFNCNASKSILDLIHPQNFKKDFCTGTNMNTEDKFIPPPPLPPFPLCPEMTTHAPSRGPAGQTTSTPSFTTNAVSLSTQNNKITSKQNYSSRHTTLKPTTSPITPVSTTGTTDGTKKTQTQATESSNPRETTAAASVTPTPLTRETTMSTLSGSRMACKRKYTGDGFCRGYGYFAHPSDCRKYIVCDRFRYFECQCKPDTQWDMRIKTCVHNYMSSVPCLTKPG